MSTINGGTGLFIGSPGKIGPKRSIRTMYWANNIAPSLPELQAQVLNSLGLTIQQDIATGTRHGDWLQHTMEHLPEDESILFLDVDAFPLSGDIVERAFRAAERGGIFGVAQAANHLDPTFIYAGPMFLCLSKRTWNALGRPSLRADDEFDVAGRLTAAARDKDVKIDLIFPNFVAKPKWAMPNGNCLGTATFYEGSVFHLFESRALPNAQAIFAMVAEAVIRREPIDFIKLHWRLNSVGNQLADLAYAKWTRTKRKIARRAKWLGHA